MKHWVKTTSPKVGDGEYRKGDDLARVSEVQKLVKCGKVKSPPCVE